ncbi:GNAT family N-acetyltransferase [Litoribrevibacter albus]|uniref:Aerobactin siderophore synthesis protein IucB n=1 Tax=Litoribrevibacter albus TaxID=1473156 RepID=A0AA37W9K1_9GAMM|nr:GNAT family N-acetyltransferase [Litoribrevibacter albus]GLQ32741.1 aerobactin siderophore synthesis protein IucB [Litoribrevibacter albus]
MSSPASMSLASLAPGKFVISPDSLDKETQNTGAQSFVLEMDSKSSTGQALGQRHWQLDYERTGDQLTVTRWLGRTNDIRSSYQVLDQLIASLGIEELTLSNEVLSEGAQAIDPRHWQASDKGLTIQRDAFYQIRETFLADALLTITPDIRTEREGVEHPVPVRPQLPEGVLYRRQIPQLNVVFELYHATVEHDGERFHKWQNDPRVAEFWEYPFSREKLDEYLHNCRNDAHSAPLIACFDGVPFGYIETYWGQEDRLGPYYDARPFDHGFHLLVGEPDFLGGGRAEYWLKAVSHFLFLLDPRTDRLVGEPRSDNKNLLKWTEKVGWRKDKEFDFPHKRAALMICDKAHFIKHFE